VGVTCLADGADQLFARVVLDHGGRIEVVVPARRYRDGLPAEAHASYDELLAEAVKVYELDREESDEQAHMAASEAMLDMVDALFAVWDGKAARGYGGTADAVKRAQAIGIPVQVLWPAGATRD